MVKTLRSTSQQSVTRDSNNNQVWFNPQAARNRMGAKVLPASEPVNFASVEQHRLMV